MAKPNSTPKLVSVVNDSNLLSKLEAAGAKFVALEGKAPNQPNWNDGHHCVRPEKVSGNVGLLHSASNTFAFDVDDYERTKAVLAGLGFDLDDILARGWRIISPKPNRAKAIYSAPEPDGNYKPQVRAFSGIDKNDRVLTLFELREGKVQDFIWGIHPDTGTPLAHGPFNGFPPCPPELLELRKIYEMPEARGRKLVAEAAGLKPINHGTPAEGGHLRFPSENRMSFNARNDVQSMLERIGYQKASKGRWIKPDSSTNIPGILNVKDDLWVCFHAGDPLEGLFDAWTINVIFAYKGVVDDANKAEDERRRLEREAALGARKEADERLRKDNGLGLEYPLADLMATTIKPVNWVVQDMLPPGLTLLAAPPKAGKSFLVLQLALAVAGGTHFLSKQVRNGKVLYFDLESSPRIQKQRLEPLIKYHGINMLNAGRNLKFRLDSSRGEDAAREIREYLESADDLALVIVDVFVKVRDDDGSANKMGVYRADYEVFQQFRALCDDYPDLCLLFVHHTNKGQHEDPMDAISGSNGIAGVTNTNWVMKRVPTQGINDQAVKDECARHMEFFARGKEIHEHDLTITHAPDMGGWELSEMRPWEIKLTAKRQEIVDLMRQRAGPWTAKELHAELGGNINTLRNTLQQMVKAGQLVSPGVGVPVEERGYTLPPDKPKKF